MVAADPTVGAAGAVAVALVAPAVPVVDAPKVVAADPAVAAVVVLVAVAADLAVAVVVDAPAAAVAPVACNLCHQVQSAERENQAVAQPVTHVDATRVTNDRAMRPARNLRSARHDFCVRPKRQRQQRHRQQKLLLESLSRCATWLV